MALPCRAGSGRAHRWLDGRAPLGLVPKRGTRYPVAGTEAGRRSFRAGRVLAVAPTGRQCERPPGFDLAATWREAMEGLDHIRLPLTATVLLSTSAVGWLQYAVGAPVQVTGEVPGGRAQVQVRSYNVRVLARQLVGLGATVEVVGPEEEVRVEMRRLVGELAGLYLAAGTG